MNSLSDAYRPSISVCMAAFNGEQHIGRQIRSILEQLTLSDELIISDDGSTDQTKGIIDALQDSRIRFVANKRGRGVIQNFQNALEYAKGDYIFLTDQDDVWLSNKVETITKHLAKADLILSNCQIVGQSGRVIHESFFDYRNSKPGFWRNLWKNSYVGCCMAFRRDVLSYALPIPTNVHMHDWWIGLLVEAKGNVVFVADSTMLYVRHGANASPTGESSTYSYYRRLMNRFFILIHVAYRLLTTKRSYSHPT